MYKRQQVNDPSELIAMSPYVSLYLRTSPSISCISQVNDPSELIAGFEEKHLEMVKAMRGVPGVLPARFAEASQRVRHCALSLVGEHLTSNPYPNPKPHHDPNNHDPNPNPRRADHLPLYLAYISPTSRLYLAGEPIIYPRINEMISGLHRKGISTFMVTLPLTLALTLTT